MSASHARPLPRPIKETLNNMTPKPPRRSYPPPLPSQSLLRPNKSPRKHPHSPRQPPRHRSLIISSPGSPSTLQYRRSLSFMAAYELYRKSSIGSSLVDALDELVTNGTISPLLAVKVLMQFDKSMNEALSTKVKVKTSFKGHLHTYRFCDNVWTFILENATFKTDNEVTAVDRVKIVACDAKILAR